MDQARGDTKDTRHHAVRFGVLALASAAVWPGIYSSVLAAHRFYCWALGSIDRLPATTRFMLSTGLWWPVVFLITSAVSAALSRRSQMSGGTLSRLFSSLVIALLACAVIHQVFLWFPATQFGSLSKK